MRKILLASHNAGKLAEFAGLLGPLGVEVVGAGALGLPEPEETGASFAQNAKIKAQAAALQTGLSALADDSGLCVAALGGGPGVYSARFAGQDYAGAFERIMAACVEAGEWRARFVCALCLAEPGGATRTFIGQVDGLIARAPEGVGGFGYDPIFIPAGYTQSFAVLGAPVKDRVSHRARAVAQLLAVI